MKKAKKWSLFEFFGILVGMSCVNGAGLCLARSGPMQFWRFLTSETLGSSQGTFRLIPPSVFLKFFPDFSTDLRLKWNTIRSDQNFFQTAITSQNLIDPDVDKPTINYYVRTRETDRLYFTYNHYWLFKLKVNRETQVNMSNSLLIIKSY